MTVYALDTGTSVIHFHVLACAEVFRNIYGGVITSINYSAQ